MVRDLTFGTAVIVALLLMNELRDSGQLALWFELLCWTLLVLIVGWIVEQTIAVLNEEDSEDR